MAPYTHFHYCGTKPKQNWHAWIAGPSQWFECHQRGRTKPCLHIMTGGELACPYCQEANNPVSVSGYLPLYREIDGRPVCVVLHEYAREQVEKLRLHQRVLVGRGDSQSDGTYVIPAMVATPRYHSSIAVRMRPADITRTLLTIWRIPELVEWHARREVSGDNAVSLPPPPPAPVTPPVTVPDDDAQAGSVEERNRRFVAAALAGQIGSGGNDHDDAPPKNGKAKKR